MSETGIGAVPLCRASSCSTRTRSSRTRSKISLVVRTAMAPSSACPWRLLLEASTSPKKRRKFAAVAVATSSGTQVSHTCQRSCYLRDVRGLVAPTALGLRRQIRAVGLDQQAIERDFAGNVAEGLRLRVRRIAREGNHEPNVHPATRVLQSPAKTVENAAQPGRAPVRFQDSQAVVPRLTAMNDDGPLGGAGMRELESKRLRLDIAR